MTYVHQVHVGGNVFITRPVDTAMCTGETFQLTTSVQMMEYSKFMIIGNQIQQVRNCFVVY